MPEIKTLREARAELLAPHLRGRTLTIHATTYDDLHRHVGLSRKEVQEAIDDLVKRGDAKVEIEDDRIVVRGNRA